MNSPEKIKRIANKAGGVGGIGDRLPVRPMEAVAALYSKGHCEISLAILSSLSKAHLWRARAQGSQLAPQVLAGINPIR